MLILALDPSSTACGWALFDNRALSHYGTVKRGKRGLADYAKSVPGHVFAPDRVVYEINDSPMPRARQKALRMAHEATGRILQALGVDGEPVRADRKRKKQRRSDMVAIYKLVGVVSEHAIDAIALGHRVSSEIKGIMGG